MLFAMFAMASFAVTYPKKPYTGTPATAPRSIGNVPANRSYQNPAVTSRSAAVAPSGSYSSYPTFGTTPSDNGGTDAPNGVGSRPHRVRGQVFDGDMPDHTGFEGGELWQDGTTTWEWDGTQWVDLNSDETKLPDASSPMPVGTPVLPLLLMAVAAMGLTYYRRRKTA